MLTRQYVEAHLIAFEPEQVLPALGPTVKEIYENREFIRMAAPSDFAVRWLATRILEATRNKSRFRKMDCLRILRRVLRNEPKVPLTRETIDILFEIYTEFIFTDKEEVQWWVSSFLKNRQLSNIQIQWLVENAPRSEHLVNRLLKYPEFHPAISAWASNSLTEGHYPARSSELIARLITDRLPQEGDAFLSETVMWAIYHSNASKEDKEEMLLSRITLSNLEPALQVAMRIKSSTVVKYIAGLVADDAV